MGKRGDEGIISNILIIINSIVNILLLIVLILIEIIAYTINVLGVLLIVVSIFNPYTDVIKDLTYFKIAVNYFVSSGKYGCNIFLGFYELIVVIFV